MPTLIAVAFAFLFCLFASGSPPEECLTSQHGLAGRPVGTPQIAPQKWTTSQNKDYGKQVGQLPDFARAELKAFREMVATRGLPAAEKAFDTHSLDQSREWAGHRALVLAGRTSPYRVIYRVKGTTVEIVRVTSTHLYRIHGF